MKNLWVAALIFICPVTALLAQDATLDTSKLPKTIYFFDDFVDYRHAWNSFDNESARAYIKNGVFYFQSKTESGYQIWDDYNIKPDANYYIEMDFTIVNDDQYHTSGNGLLFNHNSTITPQEYSFVISSNKNFAINREYGGQQIAVKGTTFCPYIEKNGLNKLAINFTASTASFYINGHLVFKMPRPVYYGGGIGIETGKYTGIGIDKFIIRYNPQTINLIDNPRPGIKRMPLDSNINTGLEESAPLLSADGKMMFFSRVTNPGSIGLQKNTMMYTEFDEVKKDWAKAQPLPTTVNQGKACDVVFVSADKKNIVINCKCDAGGRFLENTTGISESHKTATGWSKPENIPLVNVSNRSDFSSFCFSADNKTMILAIDTKGGYGELDLYVSFKKDGKWGTPKNLGAVVNTMGIEYMPCLAPDNSTLYFASTGHAGYGLSDIFVTRRLDDTWQKWSEPQNLGPEINTILSDAGLRVDGNGLYAYLSSMNTDSVADDICKVLLPEAARPKQVVIVSGKVFNKANNKPLSARVIYENLETGHEEGFTMSDSTDGSFSIVLPAGINYGLIAESKGFIAETKNMNLVADSAKKGIVYETADLLLTPLNIGATVKLNNIFFGPNKFVLDTISFPELNHLAETLKQNPGTEIKISGHTDKGGNNATPEKLQSLSENRARSVKDYLVSRGIAATRIEIQGYGYTQPISTTKQSLNRRVEIMIMKI